MFTKCALCEKEQELQLSHIIPKFIGKYLKNTSIGNIRSRTNPNYISQDIEKHYMLCHDCEELFSASERYFANTVFYPYQKSNQKEFNYDQRLYYFITSLSWRSLKLDIFDFNKENKLKPDIINKLNESEKIMKEYLLNKRQDLSEIEHHIFFFDRIQDVYAPKDSLFKTGRPHTTVHRSLTSYSGYSDNTIYTISNLMGIIIITLYLRDIDEIWNGTKIINGQSSIIAENQIVRSRLGNEFAYWMEQDEKATKTISEETKQKILKKMIDLDDKIKDYKIYQDMIDDIQLKKGV